MINENLISSLSEETQRLGQKRKRQIVIDMDIRKYNSNKKSKLSDRYTVQATKIRRNFIGWDLFDKD